MKRISPPTGVSESSLANDRCRRQRATSLPHSPSRSVIPPDQLDLVADDLDLGEREAIALAYLLGADLLLIDELSGRAEARRRRLRATGTLGILRTAAEKGLIDVPETLARFRETSFYVDEHLISSIFGEWQTS